MYVRAIDPGYVRVSRHPDHAGIRMPIIDLIYGLAARGRAHA